MAAAVEIASSAHLEKHGKLLEDDSVPALVEIAHEIRLHSQTKNEAQCCPCTGEQEEEPAEPAL